LDWLSTAAGVSRSFVKENPLQHWRGARHDDKQAGRGQQSQGSREEAFAARDQDHGEEDVHEANKEGGQFVAQKKKTKFKGVREER
jgi:hypothetical protein